MQPAGNRRGDLVKNLKPGFFIVGRGVNRVDELGYTGINQVDTKISTLSRSALAQRAGTAYPSSGVRAGPPAAAIREPRQAREGAAVTEIPGAGVWLARIL